MHTGVQRGASLCGPLAHLELGCLVEIGSTDTLSDNVPVGATRGQAHPLLHHDILELSTDLPNLEQDTGKTGWSPSPPRRHPFLPTTPLGCRPTFRMALAWMKWSLHQIVE